MSEHLKNHLICVHNLDFSYGNIKVLEGIDLCIEEGEYLGILGPNGSGKTTLLKLILGVLPLQKGRISLFGKDIKNFKDWGKVGFVPQKATQIEAKFPITVHEVVSLNSKDKESIDQSLDMVGMLNFKNTLITQLSGGQQQRVFIAKALAGKPKLLVLDEPTVGIDTNAQKEFYNLLEKLNKEYKLTLLIVSHDTDVIVKEVSRIVCINKKMVCHVTPKEFVSGNYLDKLYDNNHKHITHQHEHS